MSTMNRYLIREVKCDITEGGMSCGPVPGNIVVSVRYEYNGKQKWFNNLEVDGIPVMYITEKDIFDILLADNYEEDFIEDLEKISERKIGNIHLDVEDYNELFEQIFEEKNSDVVSEEVSEEFSEEISEEVSEEASLLRYVIALTRCGWDDVDRLKAMAAGKYADELNIPASDLEEEYLEDL